MKLINRLFGMPPLKLTEQQQADERTVERRGLCAEYFRNVERRIEIVARLVELNGEAGISGAVARLDAELQASLAKPKQAMMIAPERLDKNLKVAFSIAAMPVGVVEDDATIQRNADDDGVDGLAGVWRARA